jgi:NAD(P)H-nitrite reductase large subunit
MNYVIIGNSIASVGCIESIRNHDKKGKITVIGDESHQCYGRPLISYLLQGKTTREKMVYRSPEFYEQNDVSLVLGKRATKIDTKKKKVVLEDGTSHPFDKLLVATGSRPFVPPMKNLESVKHRFTFMNLDDAVALEKAIDKQSRVLIVGAGLIGLKCAEGIKDRVKSITVVDLAGRILPSILDETGAGMVQRHLESKGISFVLGDSVAEFQDNEALLSSGTVVGFDILVLAVGVRPNTALVGDAGGETGRGIVVDRHCQTSLEDIYAAGDCTEGFDMISGERRILAILPNAYMQGEVAGSNMAGTETTFDKGMAMNAIGFFGMHIITAGTYDGKEYTVETESGYKHLFVKDNKLSGYILIGDMIDRAGIYTSLVRNKTDLDTIDFELIVKQPMLMAFAKKERKQKLGGVQ